MAERETSYFHTVTGLRTDKSVLQRFQRFQRFQHCKVAPKLPVLPTNPAGSLPSAEAAGTGVDRWDSGLMVSASTGGDPIKIGS